ncbi:FAD-dependent monooxygenase [Gluconobacter sp. OJB]|uniref:FAD-dependent monooxygenase n=1 Tax=Gluconobacter sp. OJB TaxID=3145196 RepID=UPI0031F9A874
MKISRKILICGGGVAGPVCAYWLHKYGYSVVIVEKSKELREGGQNVDIKGAGQQIIKMMGLKEAVEDQNTGECGVKFFDPDGYIAATYPKGAFGGLTADFEILRGNFSLILYEAVKDKCDYRFGSYVTALDEKAGYISVKFNDGTIEDFEFVICAEGVGSSSRKMVLSTETRFRYLGAYMAFFKIPKQSGDDCWAQSIVPNQGTTITLRPGDNQMTTVLMTFLSKKPDKNIWKNQDTVRISMLQEALKGRGIIADRVRGDLGQVNDFYFGQMMQVKASRWSKGRFVMLGDAAYCPTPFTGEGTALSLVGAYLLASEIRQSMSHTQAFDTYEALLRPYVEKSQAKLSPRIIRMMHPQSAPGQWILRSILRFCASRQMQFLLRGNAARSKKKITDDFVFPDYKKE